jgi:hypothetical protein
MMLVSTAYGEIRKSLPDADLLLVARSSDKEDRAASGSISVKTCICALGRIA